MDTYRRAFEVNLFSVYRSIQLVAPHMIRGHGGNIVNISSDAAQAPGGGRTRRREDCLCMRTARARRHWST
ncbi:SDR family NAD(P)-dependent oxidoreductase [Gordonia polyisoprenivorans]|uniref:SDR family NAD(P)-dependent oxidoreductase n=1 Tax=Gordonia polyisoprenivorans TaxID=84595 RepID=UPI001AD7A29E|nr:SDR family NAD(P)-dependent oxidoreductase [Gordonia polyisoprenivorans]